jgi:adenosylcobinamide-GDP ribazoletransferase
LHITAHKRLGSRLADGVGWLLVAVSFLTISPTPSLGKARGHAFGPAVAYFPLVGMLLGAFVAGVDAVCGRVFSLPVVTVFDLGLFAVLTGGLHLDGLMDSSDGLLGGRDPEHRLAIMRDSRVGSFGVLSAILVLLLEYSTLAALEGKARATALILAPTMGRWAMAVAVWAFPYARSQGKGVAFKIGLGWPELALATYWATLTVVVLDPRCVWLLAAAGLAVLGVGRWITARLGGLTGDSYGAICELATAATFVLLSVASP